MDEHRSRRISETVREELSELIGFEMDDPRVRSVTVMSAEVSSDMRHAHIRVAVNDASIFSAMNWRLA
jgi:ribosome-binding factor A